MIQDDLCRLLEACCVENLWPPFLARMQEFGFKSVLYGVTRQKSGNNLGSHEDFVILSNMPSDYLDIFLENGLYLNGPMVRWAMENVGPCSWSWMSQNIDSFNREERRVFEFNQARGVRSGYSISFRESRTRQKGAIALIADSQMPQSEVDALWARHGRDIEILCNVFHLKVCAIPLAPHRRNLTSRQREVLEWVGDGKTMMDIAQIMGLKLATVEKHLRRARDALDVETTAQAVLKAATQNQIYILNQ